MQEFFEIGQIVNTSGLKGVVKANLFTDEITKIEEFKKVLIEKNKELKEYEIEEVKYHRNQALIKFKDIDTIDSAESLRNCLIKVHRSSEKELPKDTFYIVDLIGLDVYTDENEKIGKIKDVFSVPSGSHDIYVVETSEKDILLPAIGDVIKDINIADNKMIVHLIEGLI
jgi:16S rRNA processing protein RimM